MQTPFITDWRAKALTTTESGTGASAAVLTIQYLDHAGRAAGTSVILASDLAAQARAMLALAEAAALTAAGADGAGGPLHHHFPIMRDVRLAEVA